MALDIDGDATERGWQHVLDQEDPSHFWQREILVDLRYKSYSFCTLLVAARSANEVCQAPGKEGQWLVADAARSSTTPTSFQPSIPALTTER